MRSIKDEDGLHRCGQESHESIEQGSNGGIGATSSSLVLKLPYRKVDGYAQGPAVLSKRLGCELRERHSLAVAKLGIDTRETDQPELLT